MLIYALSFGFGIGLFSLKNTLSITPAEFAIFFTIFVAILASFKRYKVLSFSLLIFSLGFAWMGFTSTQILQEKIHSKYLNEPILVTGEIVKLPEKNTQRVKFIFKTHSPFKGRLKLSWSDYKNKTPPPDLRTGDIWQLLLKIKPNNGYQNMGGYDYEKWLFYQRINATGYVRYSSHNQHIGVNSSYLIDRTRQNIQRTLKPFLAKQEFAGVINALIIGDRSLISKKHWELFRTTNTTHLSVISGLHIGIISGFVFLFIQLIWRRFSRLNLIIPAQIIAAYFGLLAALLYSLIAGFTVPTERAFIMASVIFVSIILRRRHNIWQLYGLALILVLIINPLSIFSIGFWLSFYVVAVIIYGATQHQEKSWIYRLIYIQLLISIATFPLVAWFFSSGSILSPIANLIAIPVFSFVTTPFSLLGGLFSLSGLNYLGVLSFSIANQSLIYLSYILEYLQHSQFNLWHHTFASGIELAGFMLAILIGILPKALGFRWLAGLLIALILFTPSKKIEPNSVLITTLDVGQGLAHIVQTSNHILLFDTGASYSSGFNLGETVIAPYLNVKNIKHIDKIIISHGDNDHRGGLDSLVKIFNIDEILTSEPQRIKYPSKNCEQGQKWNWDGVMFEILSPIKNTHFKSNNASCVLKISNSKHSILLTGDIEKQIEKYLLQNHLQKIKSDIMIVPHHGSKSSSTQDFLTAVSPSTVVVSSGFKNSFRHPNSFVVERYQQNNIKMLSTVCSGQIDILLSDKINIREYRKTHRRYYMRQCD